MTGRRYVAAQPPMKAADDGMSDNEAATTPRTRTSEAIVWKMCRSWIMS